MKRLNKVLINMDILLLILVLAVFSWSKSSNTICTINMQAVKMSAQISDNEKQYTIGWSVFNNELEYFHMIQEGVLVKAAELGINVIAHDEQSSTIEMVTGVTDLLKEDIDALVITPYNPEALGSIVNLAKDKGIPIIVVDVGTGGTDVDASILSDNFGGGVLAGEYALKLIKEHDITSKNAAVIQVKKSSEYARRRGEAFKNVMQESGYNIVAEIDANSERTNAYYAMKELLETYGDDLAVVFAENDVMALGAAQAIEEAGKKDRIMVIGFNGDPAAVQAIKNGLMQGTIAQQPYEMGELGVELADTLLTGGTITYDDSQKKELYTEVYLIDENGNSQNKVR